MVRSQNDTMIKHGGVVEEAPLAACAEVDDLGTSRTAGLQRSHQRLWQAPGRPTVGHWDEGNWRRRLRQVGVICVVQVG